VTDAEGYTAYSYLTAGEDFRDFDLAPEFGRVPPYSAGLTEAKQERAHRLLRDSLVISLHDHPVRFPARMEKTPSTTEPAGSMPPTRAWPRPA
jgi:membrane dipeptidase